MPGKLYSVLFLDKKVS